MTFRTCECGANLDPGEICECKKKAASSVTSTESGGMGNNSTNTIPPTEGDVKMKDAQDETLTGECMRCRKELYGGEAEPDENGHTYCPECREELSAGETEEERWLAERKKGIGASDASCIVGVNPWKSGVKLWEEKTGRTPAPDLSSSEAVRYGKTAESFLRELFSLDFPQYAVIYDEYGMVRQPDRPWLFATLDGTLTERENGRRGVLEIKTTEIQRSGDWDKWSGKVPDYYYTQILHQLLATGFDFAVLKAQIKWRKDGDVQITTRHYFFERENCLEDMEYLLSKETAFWACVTENKRPALVLPEI